MFIILIKFFSFMRLIKIYTYFLFYLFKNLIDILQEEKITETSNELFTILLLTVLFTTIACGNVNK